MDGALKTLSGDYFMLGINKLTYSKQNMGCLIHLSIFPSFYSSIFLIYITGWRKKAYGWRLLISKFMTNETLLRTKCDSTISPHSNIITKKGHVFAENHFCCGPFHWWSRAGVPNAMAACQARQGGKHIKVKKRQF